MVNIGDFGVPEHALDLAREKQRERSQESRSADKGQRAPVTTSYPLWESNPNRYDFPGVDTPTNDPQVREEGLKQTHKPDLNARARGEAPHSPEDSKTRALDMFKTEATKHDVSLSPGEGLGNTAAVSPRALGGNDEVSGGERAPRNEPKKPPEKALKRQSYNTSKYLDSDNSPEAIADVYEQGEFDISLSQFGSRVRSEKRHSDLPLDSFAAADKVSKDLGAFPAYREEQEEESEREAYDFPDQTLATLRTGLNERTDEYFDSYDERKADTLEGINERISIGDPLELTNEEYREAERVVREEKEQMTDIASRMDANIFGSTEEQAERAKDAHRGFINNPPR